MIIWFLHIDNSPDRKQGSAVFFLVEIVKTDVHLVALVVLNSALDCDNLEAGFDDCEFEVAIFVDKLFAHIWDWDEFEEFQGHIIELVGFAILLVESVGSFYILIHLLWHRLVSLLL